MRYFSILLLACLASTLVADDIGVALGDKAWLLLSEPLGPGRDEKKPDLSPYAGDPGFPAPNWGGASGYAPTELWRFDAATGTYTRVTQLVTNKENLALPGSRRTLYAPFLIGGEPYVIHFDGAKIHDGASMCQVIKASAAKLNEGKKPLLDGVVLASADYIDSPVVSPDGARVAFRAFGASGCTLRVFNASDWKPVGETEARNWGRPVWCANRSLCAIAYDAAPARVNAENPEPMPGKLTRVEFAESVSLVVLLEGAFPPDTYSRSVAFDAARNRLVVARQVPRMKDGAEVGKEIVVEERDAAPPPKEIARFDHFRGIVIDKSSVYVAGVRDRAADDDKKLDRRLILMQLRKISPAPETGEKDEVVGSAHREMSPDGRGGLQDLGDGVGVMLEPALNPLAGAPGQAHFLHTLNVLNWRECDSLRNPRVIQYLSAMARRFKEIDEFTFEYGEGASKRRTPPQHITSTLLGFDLDIKIADKAIKNKKGRYLELFENWPKSRDGKGRIRVEDNIGGNWTVNTVTGNGTEAGDWVYDNSTVTDGVMSKTAAARSGTYNKLLSQMDSRKLLMLVGLELTAEKGGLTFSGRDTWRDPITGIVKRIWIFKRKGAGKDATTMGFIADLPGASESKNAHSLLVAAVAFAMSNEQVQSSILAFDSSYVELPDLSPYKDKGSPPMMLPKVVRAYARNDKGELEEQFSATLLTEFQHEKAHIKDGYVRCGYNVWNARADENFTELMMRVRVK